MAADQGVQVVAEVINPLGDLHREGIGRNLTGGKRLLDRFAAELSLVQDGECLLAGLPPTPIAAPGEAALRAALDPADGDVIFWARTDANGIVGAHTFSVTLAEHNEAVVVCRELGYCG